MTTKKSNAMQITGQSSSGENLKMQCTVPAGVMPPPFMPPYQISRPVGIPFMPPYQMINRPLLYPFMTPYTTSFMHYVPTAHGPLHASNDDKRAEVLYQSPEVPPEENVEAQQTLGGPSEEPVRSVIHDIIDDVNEIRSVPASPDLENNDVEHERNDEVNELVLGCPDLENKDVAHNLLFVTGISYLSLEGTYLSLVFFYLSLVFIHLSLGVHVSLSLGIFYLIFVFVTQSNVFGTGCFLCVTERKVFVTQNLSILSLITLDINGGLASRWVTSTVCWRQWCAVNMMLASIDVDVEFDELGVERCGRLWGGDLWSAGARGKAVVRVVAADRAGNGGLERGVRGAFLGFRRDSRFFGSLIAFLRERAEELGVNIACRQAHQPRYKQLDRLPFTSYKRQSMLSPTCACIHAVWFT
ncbi:hypothetical protein Taro_052517 [Colocasia esculenta]|uniref:Uncharacterized protein n=1 Tax=Colocasia esculenta TaxID=4460 RepID=A0A843XJZ6_COLES|nr:hypothetical protein [Colocasia esculenta]